MIKVLPWWRTIGLTGIACLGAFWLWQLTNTPPERITTSVTTGTVQQTIAVSGVVEAVDVAELSFPTPGLVTEVLAARGDTVTAGQLLATVGAAQLIAERARAVATLQEAEASRTELTAGPTSESRAISSTTVASAIAALRETIATEATKVATARARLLSNDLLVAAVDSNEEAAPPVVSGTYTCSQTGEYALEIYRSAAESGYSIRYEGLEEGVTSVTTAQPGALGECGLFLTFDPDSNYGNSEWNINIPNQRSATYQGVQNAYELAKRQQAQNVNAARNALTLAEDQATAANAGPRVEALLRANATIQAAQASIASIDARITDTSIVAPFTGIVTNVDIVPGETARQNPVITVVGNGAFSVTARLPEIDITKVTPDQSAELRFDADPDSVQNGTITFISPLPTTINGVSYFDAVIELSDTPEWLRTGLNADVEIIIASQSDAVRIPQRYLTEDNDVNTVLQANGSDINVTPVEVLLRGNDGYAAVSGIDSGSVIVAPSK